ncbi:shikimate dehydrogenase [Frigoribacterium faeni]|uniref:shikimate dehydrogenase n=1 Tax=Frigoribacterium faeni TaxID=145483 RepID=UPI001FAE0485|nr:shikimate dehydrogenase [Frigoribacterium faeni]MCJ0701473.1 shikimate dehydrogenase [Frigoribacterium faeni]
MTTPRTRLAVLGSPIAHSLSPVLHRAAYDALGLPYGYDRVEVASGALGGFVASLDRSWRGLSLTMPLKREVLPLLDTVSPLARRLGVANTVVLDAGGRRHGHNTDVDGIVRSVALRHDARPTSAVVLGGGATAASALSAAWRLGVRSVAVLVRDPRRAGELAPLASDLGVDLEIHPLTALAGLGPLDFVISTLPGGAADDLPLAPVDGASLLFDVAYEPWPTRASSRWSDAGGLVLNGLDMLVEQAISQVALFADGGEGEARAGHDGGGATTAVDEPREAARVREAMRRAVGSLSGATRASSASSSGSASTSDDGRR